MADLSTHSDIWEIMDVRLCFLKKIENLKIVKIKDQTPEKMVGKSAFC